MEYVVKSMKLGVYELNGKDVHFTSGDIEDMALRSRLPLPLLAGPNDWFSKAIGDITGIWANDGHMMVNVITDHKLNGSMPVPAIVFNKFQQQEAFTYFFLIEGSKG